LLREKKVAEFGFDREAASANNRRFAVCRH